MRTLTFIVLILTLCCASAQNQIPQIQNLAASFSFLNNRLTVVYDVNDVENDSLEIRLLLSEDNGMSYKPVSSAAFGAIGYPVFSGTEQAIYVDFLVPIFVQNARIKLVADDRMAIDIQSIVDQVDSLRLLSDLQYFAQVRNRNQNLTLIQQMQDSIGHRLQEQGLSLRRQEELYQNYLGVNLIGHQAGIGSESQMYIIDAHYDGVPNSPGADDNASGLVGVLEAARVLSPFLSEKSIRYIGFDLEESGLVGSYAYINNGGMLPQDTILGVLNLEMIGYYDDAPNTQTFPLGFDLLFPAAYNLSAADSFRGNFLTNVANQASDALRQNFDTYAAQYVPQLKVISVAVPGVGLLAPDLRRSDHANFWDAGIPALMLTDGSEFRNLNYHTPNDTLGSLDLAFLRRNVQATVATIAELADLRHASADTSSIVLQTTSLPPFIRSCSLQSLPLMDRRGIRLVPGCILQEAKISLLDIQGRLIREFQMERFEEPLELDMESYPSGIYLLRVQSLKKNFQQKILLP